MRNALERRGAAIYQSLYIHTDGRIGRSLFGVPGLLLRTTGRTTGVTRTVALMYLPDGDDLVVVASNGGADRQPGWYLNLVAHPEVEVQVGRRRRKAVARVASAEERTRLWPLANANNHMRYDDYQRLTTRQIPVVVLTPATP